MTLKPKTYNILVAEDNPDDVFLIQLALSDSNINGSTVVVNNGKRIINYLKEIEDTKNKMPDLILLDINLPKVTGLEALKQLKALPRAKEIPIVIFTSSDAISDMNYCYENGADLYFKKPNNISELKAIMKQIKEHCLTSL